MGLVEREVRGYVYLRAYDAPATFRADLIRSFQFYNSARHHQVLIRQAPNTVYFAALKTKQVA